MSATAERAEAIRKSVVSNMSLDWQAKLREFHEAFGCHVQDVPSEPPLEVSALRSRIIEEEHEEVQDALQSGDMVELADGLADLIYVALGTAVSYGIDLRPIFQEVHDSNMAKLGPDGKPIHRADGKVIKPEGWQPPDVRGLLLAQGWKDGVS